MLGIDYKKAPIHKRERFSMTGSEGAQFAKKVITEYGAHGCVILSTCNRTEFWFSELHHSPLSMIMEEKGEIEENSGDLFIQRFDSEAVHYLFELACGMHSQIFGEDQIITQVKTALQNARDNHHVDSVLETLFRLVITGAKKVKTQVKLTDKETSVPDSVIHLLKEQGYPLKGKQCLVIGNGEIGRLMARKLVDNQCQVTMTLRQYKKQDVLIPTGCQVVPYERRYEIMGEIDIIISTTVSPHLTITKENVQMEIQDKPYIFVDLAVPRDMDPQIGQLDKVTLYNMDDFTGESEKKKEEIRKAERILSKYEKEFLDWYYDREYSKIIHQISLATGILTNGKLTKEYKKIGMSPVDKEMFRESVEAATEKSVKKLLFSAKNYMEPELWYQCICAFQQSLEDLE